MINNLKAPVTQTTRRAGRPVALLFDRRHWWATLLVIAAIAVMARLGFWQLDRLEQRRARNQFTAQQLALPPLPLTGPEVIPTDPASLKTRRATAQGQFDLEQQVALLHQNWQGAPGIRLLAPLVLPGSQQAVLVDRGWLPLEYADAAQWPQFDAAGPVSVTGLLRPSETLPTGESPLPAAPQQTWYRVDIDAIQAQLPYDLLPVYLVQSPAADDYSNLPIRSKPAFDLSDGPHLGYAIQWFIFALILAGGYLHLLRKEGAQGRKVAGAQANKGAG